MAIIGEQLRWYASQTVNETASNGGRISTTLVPSGQSNSWWSNVDETQLANGATQYRKSFVRVDNPTNTVGYHLRVGLWLPTPGSDALYLLPGTMTDLQSDVAGYDRYGAGNLDSSVLTGVSQIEVLVEDGTVILFRDTELIRISDEETFGGAGNREIAVIDGTPVVNGNVVTIGLAAPLQHDYSATNTTVSSLIEQAVVTGAVISPVVTSALGAFDASALTVGNLGSAYQAVTLTFSAATTFIATSDEVTFSPNSGSTQSTYAPTNVPVGASYFSIPPAAFGGAFAQGDTITFITVPPALPIWEERVLPPASAPINPQTRTLMAFIES